MPRTFRSRRSRVGAAVSDAEAARAAEPFGVEGLYLSAHEESNGDLIEHGPAAGGAGLFVNDAVAGEEDRDLDQTSDRNGEDAFTSMAMDVREPVLAGQPASATFAREPLFLSESALEGGLREGSTPLFWEVPPSGEVAGAQAAGREGAPVPSSKKLSRWRNRNVRQP